MGISHSGHACKSCAVSLQKLRGQSAKVARSVRKSCGAALSGRLSGASCAGRGLKPVRRTVSHSSVAPLSCKDHACKSCTVSLQKWRGKLSGSRVEASQTNSQPHLRGTHQPQRSRLRQVAISERRLVPRGGRRGTPTRPRWFTLRRIMRRNRVGRRTLGQKVVAFLRSASSCSSEPCFFSSCITPPTLFHTLLPSKRSRGWRSRDHIGHADWNLGHADRNLTLGQKVVAFLRRASSCSSVPCFFSSCAAAIQIFFFVLKYWSKT